MPSRDDIWTTADSARLALEAARRWSGPGTRGEAYLEGLDRWSVSRRRGRPEPLLRRAGRGASLRVWSGNEQAFAAADGAPGAALADCLESMTGAGGGAAGAGQKAVVTSARSPARAGTPGSDAAAGPAGTADDAKDAAGFLSQLESQLAGHSRRTSWWLTLEGASRRTLVATESGDVCTCRWQWVRLTIDAALRDGPRIRWMGGSDTLAHLRRVHTAERLSETLARRLRGAAVPAGSVPVCRPQTRVLFGAGNGALLLHEMSHQLEADLDAAGWSPWNPPVASDTPRPFSSLLTLWDDPARGGMRGSYIRDDEGSLAERRLLVRQGRVVGRLGDRLTAGKIAGVRCGNGRRSSWQEPPRPRSGNLFLASGNDHVEAVRGESGLQLLVHDLEAGATDPRAGHVVVVVSDGEWLENGRSIAPVSGITLEGNVNELMAAVDRVCDDRTADSGATSCRRQGSGIPIGFSAPTFRTHGLFQMTAAVSPESDA